MHNDLNIGSIVLLMNAEYNVYKAMIVQKNIEEDNKQYEYLALPYPYCFVGVDNFTLINEENIYDIVYDSKNEKEQTAKEICPSSVIECNTNKYLVIGKNIRYVGKEEENEYVVIQYDSKESYNFEYIKESEIDNIITYGFINQEYKDLESNRNKEVDYALRSFRAFLPIGSVVKLQLEGNDIDVMIIGRNVEIDKDEISDYTGIRYDTTYIGNNYVFNFDKTQLKSIVYIGYFNKKEMEYNREILISRKIMDRS